MITVVKLGGSLTADPGGLAALLAEVAGGAYGSCVVVPGGGRFADAVRAAQARDGFDDATAHRRALDAMGRMAAVFRAIEPRLVPTVEPWMDPPVPPPAALADSHGDVCETRLPSHLCAGLSGNHAPPLSPRAGLPDSHISALGEAAVLVSRLSSPLRGGVGGGAGPEGTAALDPEPPPPLPLPTRGRGNASCFEVLGGFGTLCEYGSSPHAGVGLHGPRRRWSEAAAEGEGRERTATFVWNPIALRAGHPDIPESWDVTSDSLALWLAIRLRAGRCVLVKSADAAPGLDPAALARCGLVDAAFPAFAARYAGTIAIRGPSGTVAVERRAAA